jgi:hypothetical protein
MEKPDWLKKIEAAADKFWKEEYPAKTDEQKLTYWQKIMEKGMEEQRKSGAPIFESFNAPWYSSVKEQEPAIDNILNQLFEVVWSDRDKTAFWAATTQVDDEIE